MTHPSMTATRPLGDSGLLVTPVCLGTMTFGEQVSEADSHAILAQSLERGVNFLDTAEMYPVPPKAETYTRTETIIGNYFAANPGVRSKWVVATKVAGPSRGMPWVRGGSADLRGADIIAACEASLKRLQTDVIDLYQIHWPSRSAPMFGGLYYEPVDDTAAALETMHDHLQALAQLVQAGKVRAIGLSNETPFGVHSFVQMAKEHGLPKIASVQNPYALTARSYDNALDETLHRLNVAMLAYSPLAFGMLTGKYDDAGVVVGASKGRFDLYDRMRNQRWGRPEAQQAAKRYNQLARDNGLTPTQMALAFCYHRHSITSTIIGCTSLVQMHECYDAWQVQLSPDLLAQIDQLRWQMRDPAQ